MFLRQISIEFRKTARHPALWIGLAALLLLIAFLMFIHHSQIKYGFLPAQGGLEKDLLAGMSFYNWISGFVYAVSASVIIAYDYADLRLWLTRGLSRPSLLFARLAVILLICGLLVFLSIAANLGFAVLSRTIFFGVADGSNLNKNAILPVILRTLWSALPYLSLTVLMAVLSRSAIFAAGAMIVYANVIERLLLSLSDRFPWLARYLPGALALVLQRENYKLDQAASLPVLLTGSLTEPQAMLVIGLLSSIVLALSLLVFSRQDLGG
jgi:hypothetical protein